MTEEIINSDGSRNWEANILLDNIKRLEQENFALTQENQQKSQTICELEQENKELRKANEISIEKVTVTAEAKRLQELEQENKELKSDVLKWQKEFSRQYQINENKGYSKMEERYRSALEEIRGLASPHCTQCSQIINIIKEVLQ